MTYESLDTIYFKYDMKSLKMIVWLRWDRPFLGIWEDWLKEWDVMKSLVMVVEVPKKELSILISFICQY